MQFKDLYRLIKESKSNKIILTYPGRFQPPHAAHYAAYNEMKRMFGDDVYLTTSNKTDSDKSPFTFDEKKKIFVDMFDVPADKIIQIKNPYSPAEVLTKFSEDTPWVVGVGEKDSERLKNGKYFEEYSPNKELQGWKEKGYYFIIPLRKELFNDDLITGTMVRDVFRGEDEELKKKLFVRLYGKDNKEIRELIQTKIKG